jgi:ubiquinone/menaquinone biosynthesis C-methylase UbiE
MNNHKNAWMQYEGDAWFNRNADHVLQYVKEEDPIVSMMKDYHITSGKVLEIACSAGHRLNGIKEAFGITDVNGIDPSGKAIEFGKKHFEQINLIRGTADELSFASSVFDIVIIGFVLYVIDRSLLFKVISEVDRVLKDGGYLFVIDFFSEVPTQNPYQHISDFAAYAYKQKYEEMFLSSNMYLLMEKATRSHTLNRTDASGDYYDKYTISLLRKDQSAGYKKNLRTP